MLRYISVGAKANHFPAIRVGDVLWFPAQLRQAIIRILDEGKNIVLQALTDLDLELGGVGDTVQEMIGAEGNGQVAGMVGAEPLVIVHVGEGARVLHAEDGYAQKVPICGGPEIPTYAICNVQSRDGRLVGAIGQV